MAQMQHTGSYVGIDVSKATLEVAVWEDESVQQYRYEATGMAALIDWLASRGVRGVILEATGGQERLLVGELLAAAIPVAVV